MVTFAIVGASGQQGSNVIKALLAEADSPTGNPLLKNNQLRIRAITRASADLDSEKANSIRNLDPLYTNTSKGTTETTRIEVIQADLDNVESLVKAFSGCDGVFGVTDYWVSCKLDMKKETQHGVNINEACIQAKVPHIVFSTLEHSESCKAFCDKVPPLKKHGNGVSRVPHFDGKAEAHKQMLQSAKDMNGAYKVTCLYTSFYLENLVTLMKPARNCLRCGPCAKWQLPVPVPKDYKLPFVSVADIGRAGAFCLLNPPNTSSSDSTNPNAKNVYIQTDCVTLSTLAELISKHSDRKVVHWALSPGLFGRFPFPGADDLANMFQFKVMNAEFAEKRAEGEMNAGKGTNGLSTEWDTLDKWVEVNAKGMF